MIALDTNVVVRFLVADEPRQAARARAVVARAASAGERLFVADVVWCETVWVLDSAYEFSRKEIGAALRRLLGAREVAVRSFDRLGAALDAYERGRGDFADYLIREEARAEGCEAVVTFDRVLLRDEGFRAP
ncbi:MAG: type II toxin-antitoxin system VapC family toxin [Dehalococcoidia bacterium]|nr:type II toxin-antitoxin system VapC family toxin [Dehalococcoidia bacterium]